MQQYERNIRIYTAYQFFWGLLIIGPILIPYLLLKGLNYSQIMLLQTVAASSVVLFEVPTGALADKISRKASLILGCVFMSIALVVYIISFSFYTLALAEVLFGLGMTFRSGADSALLHESLDKLGREAEYARIEGRAASYVFIGQGVGSILSSLVYTMNPDLPFWISVVSVGMAAAFTLGFTDSGSRAEHTYHIHAFRSLRVAVLTPRILWTVLLAAVMGVSFRAGFWLYEPYFKMVHIEVIWFGTIFFFYNVVAALAARFLTNRYSSLRSVLLFLGGILALSYLGPAVLVYPWAIALIGLQQIVRGLYRPTLNAYVNRQIEDEYRATVISIVSLSANLSFAIVAPFIGIFLDRQGTVFSYAIMGLLTLVGTILLGILRKVQRTKSHIQAA